MPLVFVTDAPTLWESEYADITGVQYEFPARYRDLVAEGDRFVYYRGSRGAALGAGYFGEGIVGKVIDSDRPNHLLAAVHDVALFAQVVPIRDPTSNYYETGSQTGTNWANGVRRVSDIRFNTILDTADTSESPRSGPGFADPAHTSAMERYSVDLVIAMLTDEFGSSAVHEMPANNPGFDVEVRRPAGDLHVEVKGTVLPVPAFHLSEGQRQYGRLRGDNWRIYVIYAISSSNATHRVTWCTGRQLDAWGNLTTQSWRGTLEDPHPPSPIRDN